MTDLLGQEVERNISLIFDGNQRETSLGELSRVREKIADLAVSLWNTPGIFFAAGVVAILIQEILAVYPLLHPPTLSSNISARVCNALALIQCLASHPATQKGLLESKIVGYLYPLLDTNAKTKPYEYMKLTCLGVFGALVKSNDEVVMRELVGTELIPICLSIMETGQELSKLVAIFIVQKILQSECGLNHICETYERFFAIIQVLHSMTLQLNESRSVKVLKHILRCYVRLCEHEKALEGMRHLLTDVLDAEYVNSLAREDASAAETLENLKLYINSK